MFILEINRGQKTSCTLSPSLRETLLNEFYLFTPPCQTIRKLLTTTPLLPVSCGRKPCSGEVGETEPCARAASSWDTWQGFPGCLPGFLVLCTQSAE